ncbi:MAG: acetylornithine/succinylornithine family transaminase [Clostridia bacterium]|nr:acetylornithine/succinylornithine family transaminase [Clostridia bacterium]
MKNLMKEDSTYIAGTYKRFPIQIVSGKGSVVTDIDGKGYVDMGSGIGVTSFGIADDEWQEAIITQIGNVQHMSNLYYTAPCIELAQMLCERTGMKKVFFSNSGAESNECAIKVARKWAEDKKGSDWYTIVTLNNSFHGRTLATLSATGQAHYHEQFTPMMPGFAYADAEDLDGLREILETQKVAAVLIECIQGEGGVVPLSKEYVQGVRALTEEKDVLLMVDEVQTGNGRTGALYAYMNYGIKPDVVSTAKGLAGGLPLGATLLGEKVENVLGFGDHGSTFGGNPVSCAAACSIIRRIDDTLLEEVKEKSRYLFDALNGAPGIEGVTGMGLMIGIKTVKPASEVIAACIEKGVLCLSAKDKVRLLPALNIPMKQLEIAVKAILEACAE